MPNSPIAKRDALESKIRELLQAHDPEYRVENRLRKETFGSSRDARISLMGKKYAYAEVLGPRNVTTSTTRRTAAATTHKKRHEFQVFVWRKWEDSNIYEGSSQEFFDTLLWDDSTGLLQQLEGTSQLTDEHTGLTFTLSMPTEVEVSEVPMDLQNSEISHYLSFNIQLLD